METQETQLRALLYHQLEGRKVAFNPLEPEPFDLVDLTQDVTNLTRIYHLRTECVREALAGASLIVTDSQPLAGVVRWVLPETPVVALPFGVSSLAVTPERSERPVIGLLNHSGDMEMNNTYALKLLNALGRELLIFGHALPGLEEAIVEENFGRFCQKCDILLLPSLPGALNSTTLPLAAMAAETAVLAHNAPGYYDLDAATGVQLLPNDPAAWRWMLDILESQPAKLRAMQERNQAYAARLNRESFARLKPMVEGLPVRRPAGDCGCAQRNKIKPAPTQPISQPNPEKELNS